MESQRFTRQHFQASNMRKRCKNNAFWERGQVWDSLPSIFFHFLCILFFSVGRWCLNEVVSVTVMVVYAGGQSMQESFFSISRPFPPIFSVCLPRLNHSIGKIKWKENFQCLKCTVWKTVQFRGKLSVLPLTRLVQGPSENGAYFSTTWMRFSMWYSFSLKRYAKDPFLVSSIGLLWILDTSFFIISVTLRACHLFVSLTQFFVLSKYTLVRVANESSAGMWDRAGQSDRIRWRSL